MKFNNGRKQLGRKVGTCYICFDNVYERNFQPFSCKCKMIVHKHCLYKWAKDRPGCNVCKVSYCNVVKMSSEDNQTMLHMFVYPFVLLFQSVILCLIFMSVYISNKVLLLFLWILWICILANLGLLNKYISPRVLPLRKYINIIIFFVLVVFTLFIDSIILFLCCSWIYTMLIFCLLNNLNICYDILKRNTRGNLCSYQKTSKWHKLIYHDKLVN